MRKPKFMLKAWLPSNEQTGFKEEKEYHNSESGILNIALQMLNSNEVIVLFEIFEKRFILPYKRRLGHDQILRIIQNSGMVGKSRPLPWLANF